MVEYDATQRPVAGVLMISGALPLQMLGVESWPTSVPAQIHYTHNDPFRRQDWLEAVEESIRPVAALELFDYPGDGHLFTDASLPEEYQPEEAELLWKRVLAFGPLARGARSPERGRTTW